METKPIVTCHGDQSLFSSLHASILQGLPQESVEWRRSYGRLTKTVYLEASFVPFDEDILPTEDDKMLISRLFFHIFWTDCDLEAYKQTVREEITEWCTALKAANIQDWLIVVVVSDETKVKSKLLPRSSVIDKVRSDFCSKQSDRCIVLTEPLKMDQKSLETWQIFFSRLRLLLLQSFNKTLNKYEENMRSLREKRNEVGWNFCDYFLVQEELAFMFEMLGVFDEALLQYDELDALFTQFLLNHAAGEMAEWLTPFIEPCTNWAGISLSKTHDRDRRDLIKTNKVSLLEFRNYLFSRQCALLFILNRPWEVAERAGNYLHNTVQEMKTLEIQLPEGSLACWVFLSCLELLQTCERYSDSSQVTTYSLYTANLWDFARRKLKDLGVLCGLMPDPKTQPSSEQLNRVVDLLVGMGITDEDSSHCGPQKPINRLREALSSKEAFQRHYLELSELAMGTFKHIGRVRSARIIGKDLAEFYMKQGQPMKAEGFLLDAMKMYKREGWDVLAVGSRVMLAQCQKNLENPLKYVRTVCHVACSKSLKLPDQYHYMDELLQLSAENKGPPFYLKSYPAFVTENILINTPVTTLGEEMSIDLEIISNFPKEVQCDEVSLGFSQETCPVSHFNLLKQRRMPSRKPSQTETLPENIVNLVSTKNELPSQIDVTAHTEFRHEKLLIASGIVCTNSNELLKRSDSSPGASPEAILKLNYKLSLVSSNVTLTPGKNLVHLTCKTTKKGVYKLGQLCIKIHQAEFIRHNIAPDVYLDVVCQEPEFIMKATKTDRLVAGVKQEVRVCLQTGSIAIPAESVLKITTSRDLCVSTSDDADIILPATPADSTVEFIFYLFQALLKSKDVIEGRVTFESGFLMYARYCPVTFHHPLSFSHQMYTCKEKKYIQVTVRGSTDAPLELSNQTLEAMDNEDIELVGFGKKDKWLTVHSEQSISFVWYLKSNTALSGALDLVFTVSYQSALDEEDAVRQAAHHFRVESLQTLFIITSKVESGSDQKVCKVGSMCNFTFSVMKTESHSLSACQLFYEVIVDNTLWAVSGKVSGTFSMPEECKFTKQLQVVPLTPGSLPFPVIKLTKWIQKDRDTSGEIWIKRSDCEQPGVTSEKQKKESFDVGQVYNSSLAKQVHVYSEPSSTDVECVITY